ncbi:MAG: polysaccharide biosynthesis tyrosine autokinase [Pleurocapsa sp. CRU_1_2]|nr:polysaccharide biosynthesis tyrosine autokinase [Pleurocapsa sp. CRU_1_2]
MNSNVHLDEYINFQKYWMVLKRRWLPTTLTFAGIITLALIGSLSLPKIYEAEAELLIIKNDETPQLTGLEGETGKIEGLTYKSDPVATEAKILESRSNVEKLIKELDLQDDNGELLEYESFIKTLKVKPIVGTDLFQVIYTNKNPEVAALVVNKLVELYIKNDTVSNRYETTSAREFIVKQLPTVESKVKEAEANLRIFKNQNSIASLGEETTANIGSISLVANQIDEVEAELEDIHARYDQLQVQLDMSWQEASAVSSLSQSLAVQKVLEQLQEVKIALAQKRNYLSDNAPQIITLKDEERDLTFLLDKQIAKTLGNQQNLIKNVNILSLGELKQDQIAEFANLGLQKTGLEKKLQALNNAYNSYEQKSNAMPELQEQQRELERHVEAAQSTYQTLLSKLQETQIAEQQNVGNVRIVSNAVVPKKPVGPKKKLIVAGSGILGALLGVALAFFLDIRDKTIKNSQEIEDLLPYPLKSIIPDFNKTVFKKQLLLPDSSTVRLPQFAARSIYTPQIKEVYQDLQIKLRMLDGSTTNKFIAVTSGIAGEGKSTVAANLAIAKAQCGQKVLLIDGDLRRPIQHNLWDVPNSIGLIEVLKQEISWGQAIQNVMPNLDILTSGSITSHPISLLDSLQMKLWIPILAVYYDYIIFDTPPLIGLADTKILGKLVDGLLFVVCPGVANYGSITTARQLLVAQDFNVLGVVANGVDLNKEPYGHESYYLDKKYLEAG